MLQQTQVSTVLPYFERWMAELPDFAALAAAPERRVLKLWEGLGYYRRARNLLRMANLVTARADIPREPEAWREFPGVGPYTAAAITSIAFGSPVACVDGNVIRVLARLTGDATEFRDGVAAARAFAPLAQRLLSPAAPGDHNQAMMELGATICVRHNPRCGVCPVRRFCAAARLGAPESYPRLASKTVEKVEVTRIWCENKNGLLLHRAHASSRRLAGQHELPTAAQTGLHTSALKRAPVLARKKRRITRFEITETIRSLPQFPISRGSGLRWVPWGRLEEIVLSGPHRKWIETIRNQSSSSIRAFEAINSSTVTRGPSSSTSR